MSESDGSIIIDSELRSEGFSAGTKEIKGAIVSLINEIRNFGADIKKVFDEAGDGTSASSAQAQAYEDTISSLRDEIATLKEDIAGLKSGMNDIGSGNDGVTKTTEKVTSLDKKLNSLYSEYNRLSALHKKAMNGDTVAADELAYRIENLKSHYEEACAQAEELSNAKVPTEEYQHLQKILQDNEKELENCQQKLDTLKAHSHSDSQMQSALADVKAMANAVTFTRQQIAELENSGQAFTTVIDPQQLESVKEHILSLGTAVGDVDEKFRTSEPSMSLFEKATAAVKDKLSGFAERIVNSSSVIQNFIGATQSIANATRTVGSALGEVHPALGVLGGGLTAVTTTAAKCAAGVTKLALKGLGKLGKTAGKIALSGLKKLGGGLKNLISKFNPFRKSAGGAEGAIVKLGKKLTGLGSMLKRMVLRKAMQAMIQGVKDGMNNLAQYSDSVNGNLSTLKSGLTQLKNSLATAFAPILNVITPILSKFIGYLTEIITKVGQFFSALTGKSTFTKAVKVQENYAESLDKSSKSSGKAAKAAKKLGDALDLDEVHDIQSKNDSDSSSSGVSPADMFEEVAVDGKIGEFAKKIRDAVKKGDFESMGQLLGNGLNSIVEKVNGFATKFKWQEVTASVAKGLNGLISGVNWKQLGTTLGNLINIPIQALYGFVTTFDWADLGSSLAAGLTSLVETIDWAKAAQGLSTGLIGIITSITTFIEDTDWQEVGNKIAEFLRNVDWNGIIDSLLEGIGAVIGGLAALLWGLIEDAWNDVIQWWRDVAQEDGKYTFQGVLNGIKEGVKNIGNWIVDHIFVPFINGFRKAFKIKSPSKVMEGEGGFVVAGFKNGVKGLATAGLEHIKKLRDSMKEKFNKLRSDSSTWGKDICLNLSNGIKNNTFAVGNAVSGVASKIKSLIGFSEPEKGPLSNFHTYMPDMLKLMADGINKNKDVALNAVSGLAGDIEKRIQSGEYTFSNIGFESDTNAAMTTFTDTVVDSFSDMLNRLQAIAESVTFTTPQVVKGIVPYGSSSDGGAFPKAARQEFLGELYDMFKYFVTTVKANDNDKWKDITFQAEFNVDGQRLGRVVAKPVHDENVRSGRVRINDSRKG